MLKSQHRKSNVVKNYPPVPLLSSLFFPPFSLIPLRVLSLRPLRSSPSFLSFASSLSFRSFLSFARSFRSLVPFRSLRCDSVAARLPSFSFNPASQSLPPSHLGNSSKLDCTRFGVGSPFFCHLHLSFPLPISPKSPQKSIFLKIFP